MKFNNNEYYSAIIISRTALESWRDHYKKKAREIMAKNGEEKELYYGFYLGKADALTEILKHFDDDEPNDNAPLAEW